jgi:hypothetical protein
MRLVESSVWRRWFGGTLILARRNVLRRIGMLAQYWPSAARHDDAARDVAAMDGCRAYSSGDSLVRNE